MQQASDLAVNDGRGLVVFLRGTWMHPRAWVSWQQHFDSNGYDSVIDGWTGTTHAPIAAGAAAPVSLADLLDGTAALVSDLRRAPILIGHGIGAVVAQVLLDRRDLAAAVVAIAPPAAGWVCRAALLRHLRTRVALGRRPMTTTGRLSLPAFAACYANSVTAREAALLYDRFVISGSVRPALQASWTWREPGAAGRRVAPTPEPRRPPLLLVSGGKDRLCPESDSRAWERFGRHRFPNDVTDHHVFPAVGHSLVIDGGWEDVANYCLDWLTSHNL